VDFVVERWCSQRSIFGKVLHTTKAEFTAEIEDRCEHVVEPKRFYFVGECSGSLPEEISVERAICDGQIVP